MGACTRAIETRGGRADARRNGRVHSCAWHMHIVRGGNRRRSQVPKKSVIGVRDERERERKKTQEKTSHELRRQRKGRNYCDKWGTLGSRRPGECTFLVLSAKGREGGDLAVEKGKWLPGGLSEADLRASKEMLPWFLDATRLIADRRLPPFAAQVVDASERAGELRRTLSARRARRQLLAEG